MKPKARDFVVAIYLKGDELAPEVITKSIGVKPSKAHRKGDVIGKIKPVAAKTGLWCLEARSHRVISDCIDELLETASRPGKLLANFPGVSEAYLDIMLTSQGDERRTAYLYLTREQLSRVNRLKFTIQFTAY